MFFAYIFGFSWLLILPWFYFLSFLKKKDNYYTLLFAWYLWGVIVIFFNSIFSTRWLNGWQISAGILTGLSVIELLKKINVKSVFRLSPKLIRGGVLFVFFCSFIPSSFLAWYKIIEGLDGQSPPYYQSVDFWQGVKFIKKLPPQVVVLSTPQTSSFISSWSLRPTFISHPHQSVNYNQKLKELTKFFTEYNLNYFEPRLRQWQVRYFVYSDYDRKIAGVNPAKWWSWREVININNNFIVYQIKD